MGALDHAARRNGHVVKHTVSMAATDSLQHSAPLDNVYHLTTILTIVHRILAQDRRIILNWISSHVGLKANDRLADDGRKEPPNDHVVHSSRELLRLKTAAAGQVGALQSRREEARTSPSARWFSDATDYEPLILFQEYQG